MTSTAKSEDTIRKAAIDRSGWSYPVRFFQPHNPACYLYWLLVLKGIYVFSGLLFHSAIYPSALFIALSSQALYCLPWIWFLTHKDRYEREPAKLALLGFLWGGLVAPWVMALPGNGAILSLFAKLTSFDFYSHWSPALTAPIVEESSKFVGLVMLALLARNHVRNAYDGFLLGAFVGLGFQVFENVSYIVGAPDASFGSQQVANALLVLVSRTAVGFWSHSLFTAVAGTGFGYFLEAKNRSFGHRLAVLVGFFLLASLAHGCWDAIGGFIGFGPIGIAIGTVAILLAWRFSEQRQRKFVRVLLADDVANGIVTEAELAAISNRPRNRRAYLREIKSSFGPDAAKRAGFILDAAIDLAAAIASTDNLDSPAAKAARAEIARVRGAAQLG
ncbi:PrsW family intramembrane metalloprotease [Nostoc sp. 'Peltigera membranacea cyanobiont' N6]|uniref:PrsW family intramembrane metalloprotease n=1 Tax=Nostoc sp. 'Peltigera membranacea cyanobiont' N6 TaxID=1261031 RepID=UPI000CF3101B|nr:PrsW family intramembrane metalloprotease [Nostoc sp. 'Peltigera membranacea cyanobiont' N6]AVH63237.1 PrsW family protease [Nostoc sp. 'Peltigera membranacea cyanobiont' N6]